MEAFYGILIPFLGTSLGAACVFFMKKSLGKMAESVLAELSDPQNKILAISHCNCPERAEAFKELLVKYATFKDVIVVDTAGISSMYANDGGIIVVV